MPNWCMNELEATGTKSEMDKFRKQLKKFLENTADGDVGPGLTGFFPTPKELSDTPKGSFGSDTEKQQDMERRNAANLAKYGHKDWYEWNIANWGSKWGDCDGSLNEDDDVSVVYSFGTAWSPAEGLIARVSEQFPNLSFILKYNEPGMCFYGVTAFYAGDVVFEGGGEFPSNAELGISENGWDENWEECYEKQSDRLEELTSELENQALEILLDLQGATK
jgi:hypothetical protein